MKRPQFKRAPKVIERKIRMPRTRRPGRRSRREVTEPTVWFPEDLAQGANLTSLEGSERQKRYAWKWVTVPH